VKLWCIFIPVASNNKTPYTLEHHQKWDQRIRAITGGLTISRSALGYWLSTDGVLYEDRVISVFIMCSEADIEEIVEFTGKHYVDQKSIFYYLASSDVRIKNFK
jgi:hypothetical protein